MRLKYIFEGPVTKHVFSIQYLQRFQYRLIIISGCKITGEVNTNDKELVLYPDDKHGSNENAISTYGCARRTCVHYKNAFCAAFTDYDFLWSGKVLVARAV